LGESIVWVWSIGLFFIALAVIVPLINSEFQTETPDYIDVDNSLSGITAQNAEFGIFDFIFGFFDVLFWGFFSINFFVNLFILMPLRIAFIFALIKG